MLQATVCNGGTFDVKAFCEDCLSSPEVDIITENERSNSSTSEKSGDNREQL